MTTKPLSPEELSDLDAYWRAANYLTVGQIYLQENVLLREPLEARARTRARACLACSHLVNCGVTAPYPSRSTSSLPSP